MEPSNISSAFTSLPLLSCVVSLTAATGLSMRAHVCVSACVRVQVCVCVCGWGGVEGACGRVDIDRQRQAGRPAERQRDRQAETVLTGDTTGLGFRV